MRNLRIKTFALLITIVTVLTAASVYAYYGTVPGMVQVYIADPPKYGPDVQHVFLTFYKVEIHKVQGDTWYQIGSSLFPTIDLLAAVNSSILFSSQQIPQGTYDMVRLTLSYARVVLVENGTTATDLLTVPSDLLNGFKVPLQGTVNAKGGVAASVVIYITANDEDLHLSILTPTVNAFVEG